MRIGVVGTGNRGGAIARRLLREGHDVVIWNRTLDRVRPLEAEGAIAAGHGELDGSALALIRAGAQSSRSRERTKA